MFFLAFDMQKDIPNWFHSDDGDGWYTWHPVPHDNENLTHEEYPYIYMKKEYAAYPWDWYIRESSGKTVFSGSETLGGKAAIMALQKYRVEYREHWDIALTNNRVIPVPGYPSWDRYLDAVYLKWSALLDL